MNTYIYLYVNFDPIKREREREIERGNLILGGARETRRVRDVARRRRCRIVSEVNAPSSTSYHYSLSLLHLSFLLKSRFDLSLSLSRYCLFVLLLTHSTARLWLLLFFFVCDFLFCYFQLLGCGPRGLYNIYMGPINLTWCNELGLLFSWSDFLTLEFQHFGWSLEMEKNVPTCLICHVLLWSNVMAM